MSDVPENSNDIKDKIPIIKGKKDSESQEQPKTEEEQQDHKQESPHDQSPQQRKIPRRINTNLQWQMTGLPIIYDASNVVEVISNEDFIINDLSLRGTTGPVRWTTIYITLFGHRQSLSFSVRKGVMKYHIIKGEGWVSIDNKGAVIEAGKDVLILENQVHKFFNNSKTEKCIITCDYAGSLDLRKYIEVDNAVIE